MTEPTLPTFTNRAPHRTYHRTATAPHQPHCTTRHARSRRRQRLINLGLFLYSCLLIAALVLAAFS